VRLTEHMQAAVSRRDLLRWTAALAPALGQASRLLAQDDPKFSTGVSVVNVLATVRDKQGKIAKDLVQDDFSIDEDGRPQTIRYFAKQADLPLTLGLLVDTSGSERREIPAERRASYTFFEQVLREDKDKAFVLHFDREVELLQDITGSRKDLESALDELEAQPQLNRRGGGGQQGGQPGGQQGGQQGGGYARGGTALYDAILLASGELMQKQQGRKAAILLSDGEDNGSKVSLTSAIEAAQRSDTLVYSIRFYDSSAENNGFGGPGFGRGRRGGLGIPFPGGGGGGGGQRQGTSRADGKKILQQISRETGGSYFEISSKETLDKIYAQIEDELRNQYSLGYTSDQTGGGYRKIHVTVKEKNLTVQTREGYYAHSS
jgi:VWFA-related protein